MLSNGGGIVAAEVTIVKGRQNYTVHSYFVAQLLSASNQIRWWWKWKPIYNAQELKAEFNIQDIMA